MECDRISYCGPASPFGVCGGFAMALGVPEGLCGLRFGAGKVSGSPVPSPELRKISGRHLGSSCIKLELRKCSIKLFFP